MSVPAVPASGDYFLLIRVNLGHMGKAGAKSFKFGRVEDIEPNSKGFSSFLKSLGLIEVGV
jgi:hypothetical protein